MGAGSCSLTSDRKVRGQKWGTRLFLSAFLATRYQFRLNLVHQNATDFSLSAILRDLGGLRRYCLDGIGVDAIHPKHQAILCVVELGDGRNLSFRDRLPDLSRPLCGRRPSIWMGLLETA